MENDVRKWYETWLKGDFIDEDTRGELMALEGNPGEIEDRFYQHLEFGTGGMRGILGAGTNRINRYTLGRATQGIAAYIKAIGPKAQERGMVIAYDSRRQSQELSRWVASVFNANGVTTYLYPTLVPTPMLSFGVRALGAIGGVMITASHNPAQYNGYKVYWEDGAQIASELAEAIMAKINEIQDFKEIRGLDAQGIESHPLFHYVEPWVEDAYYQAVKGQALRPELIKTKGDTITIVYTPLHGTGNVPVRRVLDEMGFTRVLVVPEQELPDPNFSTVTYPNPEEEAAFVLAKAYGAEQGGDLLIATDPDCDRVGIAVRDEGGTYHLLNGNQVGALLVDYLLSSLKERHALPVNGVIVKTIVTSEMGRVLAEAYGVKVINTLTGFKYIGEKIKAMEATGEQTYLFGYEESYGYLTGTYARDKDGVSATLLICEMALYHRQRGISLLQRLHELYEQYGYFNEELKSYTLEGLQGLEQIKTMMKTLRDTAPREIGGRRVLAIEDYQAGLVMDPTQGTSRPLTLPKSNVLKYILEGEAWLCLRPSGTEPKLKLYCGLKGSSMVAAKEATKQLIAALEALMKRNG